MVGVGAVATPEPESATVREPPLTLPVMKRAAVRAPAADGVKAMPMAQLAEGASVEPQVVVSEKSRAFVPPIATDARVSAVVLLFVIVMIWAELVMPIIKLPKFKLVADKAGAWTSGSADAAA